MAFTLVAYDETIDSAVLQALTPLPSAIDRVSGDAVLVPRGLNKLGGCYAFGVNLVRARIVAPSLGAFGSFELNPIDIAANPPTYPAFLDLFDNPYELVATEFVTVEASENGAGATKQDALLWYTDGVIEKPAGEVITVRATSATALVANTWSNVPIVFAVNLPAGRFACVGARCESATGLAFRFVPSESGGKARPGGICASASNEVMPKRFRNGNLGTWFEFDNDTPPTIDIWASGADATQVVILDLVYLGASA